ncbi:hypothetical protein AMECASPLE_033199 [Ameca splendens]|uniref:Uncharacterized protein n=1 Tax=Ameca splendens TaxID=208324 RepID=A0ABV0XVR3_9TELE
MPEEYRRSALVPIFKNKGDMQSFGNDRGTKVDESCNEILGKSSQSYTERENVHGHMGPCSQQQNICL